MLEELEKKLERFEQLERQMLAPELAADQARYAAVAREHGRLARLAGKYRRYKELTAQLRSTREVLETERDPELRCYAESEVESLQQERARLWNELRRLQAGGELVDTRSLIMEIRAGTGGEEAALFARDLFLMYSRYAAKKGWKVETISVHPTELGGFREVIFSVEGDGVYQELQFESGTHRVQRVPETEAQGRIHTSAATVAVLPEPNEVQVQIRPEELVIDTMRSGGPGGQHQNKTESGVRITHKPTGQVGNCRDEKSQHKNKAKAMRVLRSRLYEMMVRKEQAQRADQRRLQIGSGDRSERIRTYNFPQNRLSDHRVGLNLYQLDAIMAGELGSVIDALTQAANGDDLPPPD